MLCVQGMFEFRLPEKFTDSRPRFAFTTKTSTITYPHMPSRSASLNPEFATFTDDFLAPKSPRTIAALMKKPDAPMLSVHVNVFTDVTCIGFHIPHMLCDAVGLGIILRAWYSLISAGSAMQSQTLPTLVEGDPLADFGEPYPATKEALKTFRKSMLSSITIWGKIDTYIYYTKLILDLLSNKEKCRLLFVPQSLVTKIKHEIMSSLTEKDQWVSDNDVLTALLTKVNINHVIRVRY